MGMEHPADNTLITGITGADQFGESVRQWNGLIEYEQLTTKDEARASMHVAGTTIPALLAQVTRRHAERPLLAGRDAQDAARLKRVLGLSNRADIWSKYSGARFGDGSAMFATIERAGAVLLFVEYALNARPPASANMTVAAGRTTTGPCNAAMAPGDAAEAAGGVAVDFHVTSYLSGWQRHAASLLFPLLRTMVRDAITDKLGTD